MSPSETSNNKGLEELHARGLTLRRTAPGEVRLISQRKWVVESSLRWGI
jgi:hypothetical protein